MRCPAPRGALALLLLLISSVSAAEGFRPTTAFVVAKNPSGRRAAAGLNARLRHWVTRSQTLRLLEPGRALAGDPFTKEEKAIDRAQRELKAGIKQYDAFELEESTAALNRALGQFGKGAGLMTRTDQLQKTLAYLGAGYTLLDEAQNARHAFHSLLNMNASFRLEGFPKAVEIAFDEAVESLADAPIGRAEIYSVPRHAAVFVDGRFRGTTPVTIDGLTAGTHYLRIEKSGHVVHGATFRVEADRPTSVQAKLRKIARSAELLDALDRVPREIRRQHMGGQMRRLAKMLDSDVAIFGTATQSGPDITVDLVAFDVATASPLVRIHTLLSADDPSFDRKVESLFEGVVTTIESPNARPPDPVPGPDGVDTPPAEAPRRNEVLEGRQLVAPDGTVPTPPETIAGWTLIGVGSAAMVTGIVFAVLADQTHSEFRETPMADPMLQDLRSRGETHALVADIGLFGGLAIGAAGALTLMLTSKRPTFSAAGDSGDADFLDWLPAIAGGPNGAGLTWEGRF